MKTITKKINEEVTIELERLSYEIEARQSVISEMLAQNMDINTDAFAHYQKDLVSYKAQFETLKKAFEKEYVTPVGGAVKWSLDYTDSELTITLED